MKYRFLLLFLLFLAGCSSQQPLPTTQPTLSIYAWNRGFKNPSVEELTNRFTSFKNKGIQGIIYSAGKQPIRYERAAKVAKTLGLEFYALLPALIQHKPKQLSKKVYVVNGLGESAYDKPAYPRNHFVCPNYPEVYDYLENMYAKIADIPEVDGIQLDVIRFPDVMLAPALWKKYKVVMDKEEPKYDYCYCDKCVADFQAQTGINIKEIADPSQMEEWKQFRYDLITNLVNRLAKMVHRKNKKITAAVFPGPHSVAMKLVRQEWHKWEMDAFFPMNYNDFYLEDAEWIGAVCKEAVTSLAQPKPVYSGLFICPDPENKAAIKDPEYFGLLPEELAAAIDASMNNGATGICLFTAGRMTAAHWQVLEEVIKKGQQRNYH